MKLSFLFCYSFLFLFFFYFHPEHAIIIFSGRRCDRHLRASSEGTYLMASSAPT